MNWMKAALLSMLFAAPSYAQRPLIIIAKLDCRPETVSIFMAINGRDHPLIELQYIERKSYWKGEWTDDRKDGKFPEAPLLASLRLGGHRTYCRRAKAEKTENDATAAVFDFECDENCANNVEVHAGGSKVVAYSYVRVLEKDVDPADPSESCEERPLHMREGVSTIKDVRIDNEKLRLQFGKQLSELEIKSPTLPLHLKDKGVVFAFIDERAKGRHSPPLLSCIGIDLDQQYIHDKGLQYVDVKVLK
jgi:hypothetical protein